MKRCGCARDDVDRALVGALCTVKQEAVGAAITPSQFALQTYRDCFCFF